MPPRIKLYMLTPQGLDALAEQKIQQQVRRKEQLRQAVQRHRDKIKTQQHNARIEAAQHNEELQQRLRQWKEDHPTNVKATEK